MVSLSANFVSETRKGVRQTVAKLSDVPEPLKLKAAVDIALPFPESPAETMNTRRQPAGRTVFAAIAVERLRGQHSDVVVVRADGTGERALTTGSSKNGGPVWRT